MSQIIDVDKAKDALGQCGYKIKSIRQVNEGANHFIFDLTFPGDRRAICKFAKIRKTEEGLYKGNRDTLFGGYLSLDREAYLFRMIKKETGLPTPEVYKVHDSPYGKFILLEYMDGISQKECMARSGFSRKTFLDSMEFLGRDFAKIQNVTFPSFGNVMCDSVIEPPGLYNFSDRFLQVIDMRIERCARKHVFTSQESDKVKDFFYGTLEKFRPHFDVKISPPVLVFTDMHAENFFTDEKGRPSGYFDLESAQAAPAALEFYGFRFFLYNFYDASCFKEAEKAFFRGYKANGGKYAPACREDENAINFFAGCRLLELSQSYWGYIDGIRDKWGQIMKNLLFSYIESGVIDYGGIGDVWRQRDCQPRTPQKG